MTAALPGAPSPRAHPMVAASPAAAAAGAEALSLSGIDKAFDGKPALKAAGFTARFGQIHALLGENGAGKSTLMTVATGLYAPDRGRVAVAGVPVPGFDPDIAASLGIAMVHQHFKLVKPFTVAENLRLACAKALTGLTRTEIARRIAEAGAEAGLDLDPEARVADLSVAEMQRVEIVKALITRARILILDEPTAVLADVEAAALLATLRRLADEGRAIVLISHKLHEIAAVADRVTVMRAGETVAADLPADGLGPAELARLMVGEPGPAVTPAPARPGQIRLYVNDLAGRRDDGAPMLHGVQLAVHGGEIYGLAGVGGNGQTELAETIAGLRRADAGQVVIDGHAFDRQPPAARRQGGLRIVPADRFAAALAADLPVALNLALTGLRRGRFLLDRKALADRARKLIAVHGIAGATPWTTARLLSGGNAQKLVLARELGDPATAVVLAHSPTRGLDVRAAQAVRASLVRARDAGAAVLLISDDLDEILALADRIGVINRGRIVGELPGGADRTAIGALMVGDQKGHAHG
ncbi:ATP-binding cassette domain-containing protein [Tistrella mobilis]